MHHRLLKEVYLFEWNVALNLCWCDWQSHSYWFSSAQFSSVILLLLLTFLVPLFFGRGGRLWKTCCEPHVHSIKTQATWVDMFNPYHSQSLLLLSDQNHRHYGADSLGWIYEPAGCEIPGLKQLSSIHQLKFLNEVIILFLLTSRCSRISYLILVSALTCFKAITCPSQYLIPGRADEQWTTVLWTFSGSA